MIARPYDGENFTDSRNLERLVRDGVAGFRSVPLTPHRGGHLPRDL
jgi:hypothetical protein